MTKEREALSTVRALKLALEALEEVKSWKSPTRWDGCFDKEITAIKEALSSCQCPECNVVLHTSDCAVHNEPAYPKGECNCGAQPSVSVEKEPYLVQITTRHPSKATPSGYIDYIDLYEPDDLPKDCEIIETVNLYTTPPSVAKPHKRPSLSDIKPLTDEDIEAMWPLRPTDSIIQFARAIEAAHGIIAPTELKGEA